MNMIRRNIPTAFVLILLGIFSQLPAINGTRTLLDIVNELRGVVDVLPHDPDLEISSIQSMRRHGYPSEAHVVVTEDGYLLNLHRIPCGRGCHSGPGRGQPVLLVHGFTCSSVVWTVSGPEKGLAYILADAGYDVWMANVRGTENSQGHLELSIDPKSSFWDFSWHEMGLYDIAALIDWIYAHKSREGYASENPNDLILISHSMGATMFYVLLSMRPEYNQRIAAIFNMAPIGYVKYVRGVLMLIAPIANLDLEAISWLLGGNSFLQDNPFTDVLNILACSSSQRAANLCTNFLFSVSGYNQQQFNESLLPLILKTMPDGTSTKTVLHYAQEANAGGRFQQWNYGPVRNLELYGQLLPPEYNISNIRVPIASYYGNKDFLATPEDVVNFDAQLENSLGTYEYPFEHLDFIFGIDAYRTVYSDIMDLMKCFR